MLWIGIDPGQSGGIAFLYDIDDETGVSSYAHKCPDTVQDIRTLVKGFTAPYGLNPHSMFASLERVHALPQNAVRSAFKFGVNYGQWLGILASLEVPYIEVTPHKWMKHYGAMPKERIKRKNHLKHLAQQRFPTVKVTLAVSDALLIALYGKETSYGRRHTDENPTT